MPKPTTAADAAAPLMQVALLTMDHHLASAAARVQSALGKELPGLVLTVHTAAQWRAEADALQACRDDIGQADLVIVTMLFIDRKSVV